MAKTGDTVRFLNATGGGVITRIEGQLAYVEEDGFETPVLLRELVVVMPAGHGSESNGPKKMFDQKAFDEGRRPEPVKSAPEIIPGHKAEEELPLEETSHGENLNLVLAFEPSDVMHLDKSSFAAVLVNDSNYFLNFSFLRRSAQQRGWILEYSGSVAPNEIINLASLRHENLPDFEKIAFQCIAFKKDKTFTLQAPVSVSRKLDVTKFHKFHCFRPGIYFDSPVLEMPLVSDGVAVKPLEVNAAELASAMTDSVDSDIKKQLSKKYCVDAGKNVIREKPADPRKPGPLIEIDLHIGELTDSISGMEPKDMLDLQLDTVRKVMQENKNRIKQKIVFIHGKGEGVLRKAVLELLRKDFPKAEIQDASFREYGFGATLVTIH